MRVPVKKSELHFVIPYKSTTALSKLNSFRKMLADIYMYEHLCTYVCIRIPVCYKYYLIVVDLFVTESCLIYMYDGTTPCLVEIEKSAYQ